MSLRAATAERLRDLRPGAVAALVADLWAARGYETTRDGREVVATKDGDTVRIHAGTDAPASADVVVAVRGTPGADVRVLAADALAEMLLYAVDRETRDALCRRHLGDVPGALPSPGGDWSLDVDLGALLAWRPPLPATSWRPATPVLVVAVLILAGLAGAASITAPGPPADDGRVGTVDTPVAVPSDTETPVTGVAAVPGLTADGVDDLDALAAAHRGALAGRSYTAWLDRYRPRDGDPNATRVQRDVDVRVGADRSLVVASVEPNYGDRDESDRREVLSVYETGGDRYVAEATADGTRYRRLAADEPTPMVLPGPRALRGPFLTTYLATPNTSVEGTTRRDGRTHYRVTGSGVPSAFENVSRYSVVAFVSQRGFVRELVATYTVETAAGSYEVRFEVLFDRVGRTEVTAPAWYDREFGG